MGGGKATGLTGLRGGVPTQPDFAGIRGRQGGVGQAELAGSATEGAGKTELTRKPELTVWR